MWGINLNIFTHSWLGFVLLSKPWKNLPNIQNPYLDFIWLWIFHLNHSNVQKPITFYGWWLKSWNLLEWLLLYTTSLQRNFLQGKHKMRFRIRKGILSSGLLWLGDKSICITSLFSLFFHYSPLLTTIVFVSPHSVNFFYQFHYCLSHLNFFQ